MTKVKLKRFLAMTMALSMVFSTNAFATDINLENSTKGTTTDTLDKTNGTDYFADETTNNWSNGQITEEVRVNVDRASFFDITIPKEIVLNGNNGSATYEVSITGELAGDQSLVVKPDATFTLTEDGGKTTPVTVEQDKDTFNYQDINDNKKGNGTLSAPEISAGNWSGKFNFNIEFKNTHDTSKHILMEIISPFKYSGSLGIRLSKEAGAIYSPDVVYVDRKSNIVNDVTAENFDEKLENGLYLVNRNEMFSDLAKTYPNVSICVYDGWEEEFIAQFDGFENDLEDFISPMSHTMYTIYYHLN